MRGDLFWPFSVAKKSAFSVKKCVFHLKTAFFWLFSRIFKILQTFGVFWNGNFERLGLEEITEIIDLVKRFPMRVWLQKWASKSKFEGARIQIWGPTGIVSHIATKWSFQIPTGLSHKFVPQVCPTIVSHMPVSQEGLEKCIPKSKFESLKSDSWGPEIARNWNCGALFPAEICIRWAWNYNLV